MASGRRRRFLVTLMLAIGIYAYRAGFHPALHRWQASELGRSRERSASWSSGTASASVAMAKETPLRAGVDTPDDLARVRA